MDKITLKLCALHSGMRNVFRNGIIEFNRIRITLCGRGVLTRIFLAKKGLKQGKLQWIGLRRLVARGRCAMNVKPSRFTCPLYHMSVFDHKCPFSVYHKLVVSGCVLSRFRPFPKACFPVLLVSSIRAFVLFWIRSFVFSS